MTRETGLRDTRATCRAKETLGGAELLALEELSAVRDSARRIPGMRDLHTTSSLEEAISPRLSIRRSTLLPRQQHSL